MPFCAFFLSSSFLVIIFHIMLHAWDSKSSSEKSSHVVVNVNINVFVGKIAINRLSMVFQTSSNLPSMRHPLSPLLKNRKFVVFFRLKWLMTMSKTLIQSAFNHTHSCQHFNYRGESPLFSYKKTTPRDRWSATCKPQKSA